MVIVTGSKFFHTKYLEVMDTIRIPVPPRAVKAQALLCFCSGSTSVLQGGQKQQRDEGKELFHRFLSDASILWPTQKTNAWLFISANLLTSVRRHWHFYRCPKSLPPVIRLGVRWAWKLDEFSLREALNINARIG